MTLGDAWATLGIDATDDLRAIRMAYAAKLKAIDPDSDPQAFIALREARTIALYRAQSGEPLVSAEPEPQAPAPEPQPISDAERHARALGAMLHGERDHDHASDAEREEMLGHWRAIAADPRMEEIGFFAQVEHWAAEHIAYTTPFSDPLIIPATELFGWTTSDDTIQQSPQIQHISFRYGWLRYLEDVQQPGHSRHAAWVELTTPAGLNPKRGGGVAPRQVTELLTAVRTVRPDMLARFDPARVELWDRMQRDPEVDTVMESGSRYGGGAALGGIGLGLFGLVKLMPLFFAASSPEPAREPYVPSQYEVVPPAPSENNIVLVPSGRQLTVPEEEWQRAIDEAMANRGEPAPPPESDGR